MKSNQIENSFLIWFGWVDWWNGWWRAAPSIKKIKFIFFNCGMIGYVFPFQLQSISSNQTQPSSTLLSHSLNSFSLINQFVFNKEKEVIGWVLEWMEGAWGVKPITFYSVIWRNEISSMKEACRGSSISFRNQPTNHLSPPPGPNPTLRREWVEEITGIKT